MKSKSILTTTVLLILTFQACVNPNRSTNAPKSGENDSVRTPAVIPDTAGFNRSGDMVTFMQEANYFGLKQLALGNLAATKAADPKIQKYATMMVRDHTRISKRLNKLADSKKVKLPSNLRASDQQHISQLKNLQAKAFDKHYMNMMVKEHVRMLDMYKSASTLGDHPIQNFSAKTLRVLEEHYKAAKDLDNYLR